jgi:hypothetical protein
LGEIFAEAIPLESAINENCFKLSKTDVTLIEAKGMLLFLTSITLKV